MQKCSGVVLEGIRPLQPRASSPRFVFDPILLCNTRRVLILLPESSAVKASAAVPSLSRGPRPTLRRAAARALGGVTFFRYTGARGQHDHIHTHQQTGAVLRRPLPVAPGRCLPMQASVPPGTTCTAPRSKCLVHQHKPTDRSCAQGTAHVAHCRAHPRRLPPPLSRAHVFCPAAYLLIEGGLEADDTCSFRLGQILVYLPPRHEHHCCGATVHPRRSRRRLDILAAVRACVGEREPLRAQACAGLTPQPAAPRLRSGRPFLCSPCRVDSLFSVSEAWRLSREAALTQKRSALRHGIRPQRLAACGKKTRATSC